VDPGAPRPAPSFETDVAVRDPPPNRDGAVARGAGRLRIVVGLATLVMFGLSWPLWVEAGSEGFPRVPFALRLAPTPPSVSWALFAVLVGSVAAATVGIAWRKALGLALVVLTFLILQDQHRLQAWAYQFGIVALLLAALPAAQALALTRWWYVATYAYSGLSKLDVSFCRELGERFLTTAVRPFGLVPEAWPAAVRGAAILAMPAWEIAVAIGLSFPATRRQGRAGAAVLHGALIAILGPMGMEHSTIVLVWNAAMMAEVWVVFSPALEGTCDVGRGGRTSAIGWLARAGFLVGVILPLGERSGYCDAWPAHALDASHVERTDVFLHEDELSAYPAEVVRHVRAIDPGPWRRLDLTGWSRAVRGVPVDPQARACNGLAEALAARYGDHRLIRVIQWGRADRWTGRRSRVALLGLEEIRRQGDRYRLNAHPAPGLGASDGPGRTGPGPGPTPRP
jgi:hypothetical protein